MLCNLLIINLADLHKKIGTTMLRITELLSNNNSGVRHTSVNVLSKFAEHSETGSLCLSIY